MLEKYKFINDEKDKTNSGFVADEIEENIPSEFENIVNNDKEYKSLNYSSLNCILCCNALKIRRRNSIDEKT